jgi:hypothetical protein
MKPKNATPQIREAGALSANPKTFVKIDLDDMQKLDDVTSALQGFADLLKTNEGWPLRALIQPHYEKLRDVMNRLNRAEHEIFFGVKDGAA